MAPPEERTEPRSVEEFLGEPTRDAADWRWLWEQDVQFPIRSDRGLVGRLVVLFRRLLRPLFKTPLNDLWDRQRVFNLIVLEHLEGAASARRALAVRMDELTARLHDVDRHLERARHVNEDLLHRVKALDAGFEKIEGFRLEGLEDLIRHNDSLFALLDQKLDRYRRDARELQVRLSEVPASPATGEQHKV